MKSIIQSDRSRCYICGKNSAFEPIDEHHVFGGANRKISEKFGLKVYLHHWTCHLNGVHRDGDMTKKLKADVQAKAMQYYGWTVKDFIGIFGKNYLD